jgi:F-box protein 21
MSLFEGVALISQWSTMELGKLQTCLKDLGISIENITKRVNEQMVEVLCASTAKPKKKAKIILDLITHVMFNEMGFEVLTAIYRTHLHFSCISQVCSALLPLCYFGKCMLIKT